MKCPCVGKHVPLAAELHTHHIIPLYYGGPDTPENVVDICPTTHSNIHKLVREYERFGGRPPGSVRKHYSVFVQELAERAWDGRPS